MTTDNKVVSLHRKNEDLQKDVAEFLSHLDLEKGGLMMVYCDNVKSMDPEYMVFMGYDPGLQDVIVSQVLADFLRESRYTIEE